MKRLPMKRRRARRGSRPGFTMIEILVVLAVLAALAAVIGRNVASTTQSGRSAALAESLDALRRSIYAYRGDVRRYPTNLSQLSAQPQAGALDLCGRNLPTAFRESWRGPYTAQTITASGIQVGDARIRDALESAAPQGIETPGTLLIVVDDVDEAIAVSLERAYDGDDTTDAADVIRWSDAGNGVGVLRFGVAISGC